MNGELNNRNSLAIINGSSLALNGLISRLAAVTVLLLSLAACAVAPPVQEMSDARQAIDAAREANASQLAPSELQKAEESLDEAARSLEQEHYLDAREAARLARQHAIRARDKSLSSNTEK